MEYGFDMRQPIQAAVYCVRFQGDHRQYLLLRRIPSGGGYWQCITGGVEGDETPLAAAVRELREETGFAERVLWPIDYSYTFPVEEEMRKLYQQPVEIITETVFLGEVDGAGPPVLDKREHDAWLWCNYEKALELLFWPGNKESLKHCEQYLRSGRRPPSV